MSQIIDEDLKFDVKLELFSANSIQIGFGFGRMDRSVILRCNEGKFSASFLENGSIKRQYRTEKKMAQELNEYYDISFFFKIIKITLPALEYLEDFLSDKLGEWNLMARSFFWVRLIYSNQQTLSGLDIRFLENNHVIVEEIKKQKKTSFQFQNLKRSSRLIIKNLATYIM